MENPSNSESNLLHPELSREEAIRRINAISEGMMNAGATLHGLRAWADSVFSQLPKRLREWDIPETECDVLLEELSPEERYKFIDCLFLYYISARADAGSCAIMQSLFNLAGIQNTLICRKLYRKLTGAACSKHGFEDWEQVERAEAFNPLLRRARASNAVDWLSAWKFRQLNKETSQGYI